MATRLYPITSNETILEKLINVPNGTANKLKEIEDQFNQQRNKINQQYQTATEEQKKTLRIQYQENERGRWEECQIDANVGKYDKFMTYGWGRFGFPTQFAETNDPDVGNTIDNNLIQFLLTYNGIELNGVTIEELEGIKWN